MDDKEIHELLFSAIQHHNDSLLNDLLDGDEERHLLDRPNEEGHTLLHVAVIESDLRCVECLLRYGANPNVFDAIRARTPLHLAVELGLTDVVKAFLELEHVNLDVRDDRNLTCHEIAQFCDNQPLADLIRSRYDEINQLKNDFYSVMNQACSSNEPILVETLLKKYEKRLTERLPRGWSSQNDGKLFVQTSLRELINWSSSSWNDVTLLFKAASKGFTEVCQLLINYGAVARCSENTNYSPLYVAAYGGHTSTVKLMLDNFPTLAKEVTIEKWTILHACCLQGHSDTAKLILDYTYPPELRRRYTSRSGLYEYQSALDLNAQDAAGQTVIYLAVSANDEKLLDTLLEYNVEAKLLEKPTNLNSAEHNKIISFRNEKRRVDNRDRHARIISDRPRIVLKSDKDIDFRLHPNNQLNRIMRQLHNLESRDSEVGQMNDAKSTDNYLICPFEVDTYCDYNSKTALHLAVCQQYHSLATTLLVNGSNPNLPILSRDSIKSEFSSSNQDSGLNWLRSSKSTCLKEACRLNDELMCDILIRYGANDNQDNLALQVAAANKNNPLISKFLALKSNVDPDYKINKKCNVEFAFRYKQVQNLIKSSQTNSTTTFSSMFPSAPVMIDWQNLKCIRHIDLQWLIDASLLHNKRLKHPPTSLIAITRLDLSSNNLRVVHPVIFRLPSLRELNLSKNRLETLLDWKHRKSNESSNAPTSKLIESHKTAMKRSKSSISTSVNLETSNIIDLNEPQEWDLPFLEILDLHDNRLISLPDCLFSLPRLSELDISSNQIRQLPSSIWTAPALKEVLASGNLLDDLPKLPQTSSYCESASSGIEHTCSAVDEKNSFASNASNQEVKREEESFAASLESDSSKDQSLTQTLELLDNATTIQLNTEELSINHLNYWKKKVELSSMTSNAKMVQDGSLEVEGSQSISKINYLNLSHNSFAQVPNVLACITSELTRLNLSYNRIASLGSLNSFPAKLKNLDLSNNQISSWFDPYNELDDVRQCYAVTDNRESVVSKFLHNYSCTVTCDHRSHCRLESIKSINLSYNCLKDIQLYLTTNVDSIKLGDELRDQLIYPNVTALDLSYNKIHSVPKSLSKLKDMSVLNLSGNISISSLPPELGLAGKLWNLGINGCNLNEPLKSIVESKTYKTMDIIGYLRSILEDSKPYARMKLMLVGLQGIGKTTLLEQMRLESGSSSRRKAPEHWTKRMGHSTRGNIRNQKGVTLSTVGVDIYDWIFCKRTPRNQPSFGPVSFSTWDFGGQEEFYATHRYFLSKRSMYLVVWRLTDGYEGIQGIQQWLVNIQSRASSSPVIIVGTHEDMIEGGEKSEFVQKLQAEVHRRFINVSDHDKCGLPRVMDSIVVSTRTKLNIKHLCNRIYDVVFSLKCPGSTERLLEQKIPATYLYLEDIVSWIVHDRQQKKREPVLTYNEYRKTTSEQLKTRFNKTFRDLEPLNSREINYNSELQQATRFLHENGILLHYEDANLRDLYFLDPQWLCDILSHVVTIREINPHVKNGLMKMEDLGYLFKSMSMDLNGGIQSYVVNLLNKFEVALTWNSQYLLIPSLLPKDPLSIDSNQDFQVKVVPRMRGRSAVRRFDHNKSLNRPTSMGPIQPDPTQTIDHSQLRIDVHPECILNRIILLRYLPAGFFARLQSGILSDPVYDDICSYLYNDVVAKLQHKDKFGSSIGPQAGWTCWKTGIRLSLQQETTINTRVNTSIPPLLNIQEVSPTTLSSIGQFLVGASIMSSDVGKVTGESLNSWRKLDTVEYSNIIMVSVQPWVLCSTGTGQMQQLKEIDRQCFTKLLANTVDHIDNLLEDWYPSLGTRFAHTLGGSFLVNRVVPCTNCFSLNDGYKLLNMTSIHLRSSRADSRRLNRKVDFTMVSGDQKNLEPQNKLQNEELYGSIHCFYVEQLTLEAYDIACSATLNGGPNMKNYHSSTSPKRPIGGRCVICPIHGQITLSYLAPDIVFDDILENYKIDNAQLDRCKLIGRGTFGFVFKGSLRGTYPSNQLGAADQEVALKLLQPVEPGTEADQSDIAAYKSAVSNWTREPVQSACKSYCTARHEVTILQVLKHPNIVFFIGLCLKPLAIVLELAPLGCFTDVLRSYKRAGMKIDRFSAQKTISQVARALEFLHQARIIYRDLKAENVLVWSFPTPYATKVETASVELKLADYGISRQALSTGIWKGFAGTINFLAPEILRHNGDEEYTEKVDCFSFGMFIYELLTLRPPFKHNESSRGHLADGGLRPSLALRDLVYPNYFIDLMSICWSQEPHLRPTASQIVSIASTPEFIQLLDAIALESQNQVNYCGAIQYMDSETSNLDLWLGRKSCRTEILSTSLGHWAQYRQLTSSEGSKFSGIQATCMCIVENRIWLCDSKMVVHTFSIGSRLDHGVLLKGIKMDDDRLNRMTSFALEIPKTNCAITFAKHMIYVKSIHSVIILLSTGHLWICHPDTMICKELDDGSIQFACMAVQTDSPVDTYDPLPRGQLSPSSSRSVLLFCGHSSGISCIEILDHEVYRQSILPLTEKLIDINSETTGDSCMDVTSIVASKEYLWTAAAYTIHLWSLKQKSIVRKLDCCKLVPCSESLESINIENYYELAKSSVVSSMIHLNNQLFVGTSRGCFMVVEADSLKPLTVFRPYEGNITIIAPVLVKEGNEFEEPSYIVTIGAGYRDLMKRYVCTLNDTEASNNDVAILWSANPGAFF